MTESSNELIRLQGDEEGETQNNESICAKCDALVSVPNGMEFNGNAGDMCWPCTIATLQAQVETLTRERDELQQFSEKAFDAVDTITAQHSVEWHAENDKLAGALRINSALRDALEVVRWWASNNGHPHIARQAEQALVASEPPSPIPAAQEVKP